jgi:hypothetical protein
MLFGCDNGEQEIIVAPKGYKGYIVIIFNQKDGQPAKYEGKKRVYEIPQSGILKTQFTANYGWREFAEYYYGKIASENRLPSFAKIEKVPADTVGGFMGANGNANKDYEGKETVEYSLYYIGTRSDIERTQEQAEKLDIVKLAE